MTLEVAPSANKVEIRKAVEKIWEVKVAAIRTINTPEKKKTFGRRTFVSRGIKKAIITLKEGIQFQCRATSILWLKRRVNNHGYCKA